PALEEGMIVLSDRFTDATLAYQGFGRGVPLDLLRELNSMATWGVRPDLTLFFDMEVAEAMHRIKLRIEETETSADRIEREQIEFFDNVRRGYLILASEDPARVKIIDARGDFKAVHQRVLEAIQTKLRDYGRPSSLAF
ncbi:MAG: dTMP kinase, partial [Candidatus Omnitrophica bacterium]|nr:dTMP kinase [Candidatus Omnitrophota bacterium]